MVKQYFLIALFVFPIAASAQVVAEKILIDTVFETIQVIYQPPILSKHYTKKIAVFADDTSKIAIKKTTNKNGNSGNFTLFYRNGNKKIKTVYANNQLNGEWTYYNPDGLILVKGNYVFGIKEGFWAYKTLKIYGEYKNGVKEGNWHRVDANNKKVKSTYKKGMLIRGKGFGGSIQPVFAKKDERKDTLKTPQNKNLTSQEHQQAIDFLKNNMVFKKELKAHFSKGNLKEIRKLKAYFVRGEFQFALAPFTLNLGLNTFVEANEMGRIKVDTIAALLKNSPKIQHYFDVHQVEKADYLYNYSTNKNSTMGVYFSKIKHHLLRIDVVKFDTPIAVNDFKNRYHKTKKEQRFEMLLYYDNDDVLKGVEYEKVR